MNSQIKTMRDYVNVLDDETRLKIISDYDQFERDGWIGDCTLRSETSNFLQIINAPSMNITVAMMHLASEAWRLFCMKYLKEHHLVGE